MKKVITVFCLYIAGLIEFTSVFGGELVDTSKSTSNSFVKSPAVEINYFYLKYKNRNATFIKNVQPYNNVLIFESFDNNGQYVRLLNNEIQFDQSEFIFMINKSFIIITSPYHFCSFFFSGRSGIEQVYSYMTLKAKLSNKITYIHLIKIPNKIFKQKALFENMIIAYEPSKTNPSAGIEVHYWIDAPSTYFVSSFYRCQFIEQACIFIKKHLLEIGKTSGCIKTPYHVALQADNEIRAKSQY